MEHQSRDHQRASIDDDRNLLLWILPQQCCGEGEKYDAHQQQNAEPEQIAIRPFDVVEGIVMSDPVDAHEHKTQRVAQQFGPQRAQLRHEFAYRGYLQDLQVEHQQGNGDREDAITKRFEASGV